MSWDTPGRGTLLLVSLLVSDEVHRVVKDPSAGVTLEATSLVNLFVLTQASR